jgi:phosphoribosylanthranilate isomerase
MPEIHQKIIQLSILKIKICGMRNPRNIREISRLSPDYMGFIFYSRSKRYAGNLSARELMDLPDSIRKVGVFVNHSTDDVMATCRQMGIRTVQLHGDESPEYCRSMKNSGFEVFKAFNVSGEAELKVMGDYQDSCDFILMDAEGEGYGGTGVKFDWSCLGDYNHDMPFFLSGGIGPEDADRILKLNHPRLYGVDLNSRFETEPGIKKRDVLEEFIRKIRSGSDV